MACGNGVFLNADGGILSIVVDLGFAGAILLLLYPCLQRTISRLDREFFRQLFYVVEVVATVLLLAFILMLVVAQQMRLTYCSLIRPFIGNTSEDKVYAGFLLKLLVFALLVFNYFCATTLQTAVGQVGDWFGESPSCTSQPGLCVTSAASSRTVSGNNNTNRPSSTPAIITASTVTPATTPCTTPNSTTITMPGCSGTITTTRGHGTPVTFNLCQEPYRPRSADSRLVTSRDVGTLVCFPSYHTHDEEICTLPVPCSNTQTVVQRRPRTSISLHSHAGCFPRITSSAGQSDLRERTCFPLHTPVQQRSCSSREHGTSCESCQSHLSSLLTTSSSGRESGEISVQAETTCHFHPNVPPPLLPLPIPKPAPVLSSTGRTRTVKHKGPHPQPPRQPKVLRCGKTYGWY